MIYCDSVLEAGDFYRFKLEAYNFYSGRLSSRLKIQLSGELYRGRQFL